MKRKSRLVNSLYCQVFGEFFQFHGWLLESKRLVFLVVAYAYNALSRGLLVYRSNCFGKREMGLAVDFM